MAEEQAVPSEGLTLDQILGVDSMFPEGSGPSPEEVVQQYQSHRPRAGAALPREALALLDTIAGTESPDYNTVYGGRKVANLDWHPGIHTKIQSGPNAGKTSSAAGRYQFLESTWNDQAMKLGLTDFSPASQDVAAWNLAQEAYNGKTGRDLLSDLQSNNPVLHARAGNVLSSVWTSLPGGIEQGTNTNKFLTAFQSNLAGAGNRAPASTAVEGYDETPIPGMEPEQAKGPDLSNMYGIMLGDGSTLHVPKGTPPEQAIKEAMEAGIKGPFLKDIPLTNGSTLHVPWEQDPHAAMEEARASMPDANLEAVFEKQHREKTGFIPGAKSALMGAGADVLRGVSEIGQGAGQSLGLPSLEHLGDVGIQKAQELRKKSAEAVEAPQPYDPFYVKPMQMVGEVAGGVLPYMAGLAVAPEVVAPTLLAGTMGTQALGSMAGRADDQGKGFDVAPALPAAGAETAVNLVGLGTMGPLKNQLEKSFLREFAGKGVGDYIADVAKKEGYEAAQQAVGSKLSNIAAETGLNTAGISFGNVGSSLIERAQAGQSLTDPEAMDEYWKGIESGLVGGAMFGAPQGLSRKAAKEAAVEVEGAKMREAAPRPVPGEDTGWKAEPGAPEPKPPTEGGAQFPPPEGTNWYDQLGLNKRSGAYKQLKQLDLADPEDHSYIKDILERNKGYADSASVENLFQHMEGVDTTEAQAKKETFGKNLGQITGTYTDNLGRTGQFLSSVNNPELGTHVESGDTKNTLQALRKSNNPVLRGLAHMARNLPNLKIWQDDAAIRDLERRRNYPKGSVGGYYDMLDQGIRMASHTRDNEHVVGHELTHALVAHAIDNPLPHQRDSVNALHKLFDTVKGHPFLQVQTPGVIGKRGKEYGITNVHEFVSEGMNNPEFQYKLSRIKYQNTTLWGKFTSAIAKMLRLEKDNAFMELMTHTENLMPRKGTKITPIRKQLAGLSPEEVSRADQIKETAESDVGRGPQPSLRQEGEGAPVRGEGIREGRPEGRAIEKEIEVEGVKRPTTDSAGAPIHTTVEGVENFWKNFKDTQLVDDQGRPKVMYHGTKGDIVSVKDPTKAAFDREGLGSHFTADRKVASGFAESFGRDKGAIFPTYLDIKNPLRIKDTGESHSEAKEVIRSFIKQGILPKDYLNDALYSRLMENVTGPKANEIYKENNAKELSRIRDILEDRGYDGLVYENKIEGGGDAYVPFRAEQIKSATGNVGKFDTTKPEILAGPVPTRPPAAKPQGKEITHIDVDGVQRPVHDSTGQRIHTTDEGVKNFWKGFEGTKAVDEQGRPSVVYHGTDKAIEKFQTQQTTGRKKFYAGELGSWFGDQTVANRFADKEKGAVYPVYLDIKNPKVFSSYSKFLDAVEGRRSARALRNDLRKENYDGIKIENSITDTGAPRTDWVAFYPEQIKSAIGNVGKFDTTKPEILAGPVSTRPPAAKPRVEETPVETATSTTARESDPDADYAVGRGLVKTKAADSRNIIQKMKDWFHEQEKSTFSPTTRLRAHFVSRYAPWTASLKDKEWADNDGKLRADYMGSKYQQIFNTVRTGYDQGVGVVGPDGTIVIRPEDRLALGKIMGRVDSLKQFNNPREVVGFVLRALRGETLLQEDEGMRRQIQALRKSADKAEEASERATKREDIIREQRRADALRKEAKRLEEIYGKGEGEGREKRVNRQDIEKAKSLMSRHEEIKDIVNDVHDMNRALVDLWEQAELIDADTASKWRDNPAYVPLYKSEEDLLTDPSKYVNMLGRGTKTVAEIEKLLGGTHDVNIFENLQKHYAFMTMGAAQNLLRKNSSEQLEQVGAMKKITEHEARNNPLAVSFKALDEDGKATKQYYEASDPLIFEAFQAAQPLVHPLFTKVLRPTTSMFRKVTLMNPVFWFKQLVRDPIHASLVADTGVITPIHSAVAMAKILAGKSETYKKLQREGLVGAIEQFKDPKQFAESFGKERGRIGRALDKLEHIHESSDAATRVAVYDASYARAKKRGMSDERAHTFATNQAREVINFSNIGKSQAMQAIRASVPFFSATMNSLDVVARAASGYGLPPAERAQARKLFYTRALGLTALSVGYALAMQDDKDYRKLQNTNDWMKNYLIPNPAEKGTFIKVPIPFEIGYFTKVLPELWVRLASGTLTAGETKRAAREGFLSTLPPIPLPLLLRTPLETIMNYNLFTGRPIERLGQENLPVEERGRREASELAKFMSKSLGLSQAGLSPAKIDHLGRGMLTELWGTTMLLSDAYLHRDNPRALRSLAESVPLAHGLFTKPDTDRLVNTFYQAEEAAKQRRTAMRGDIKSGRIAEFKEAMQDPEKRAQYRAASPLRRIADNMSKLRHRMDLVDENKKLTQEQKTAEMKRLKESYNNLAIRGTKLAEKLGVEQ